MLAIWENLSTVGQIMYFCGYSNYQAIFANVVTAKTTISLERQDVSLASVIAQHSSSQAFVSSNLLTIAILSDCHQVWRLVRPHIGIIVRVY